MDFERYQKVFPAAQWNYGLLKAHETVKTMIGEKLLFYTMTTMLHRQNRCNSISGHGGIGRRARFRF